MVAELTYRCNHRCIFCSCPWEQTPQMKETELTADEWADVFRTVKSYGVRHITFSGGEAVLREDLFRILDVAADLGFTLGLISNGRNADDEFLSKIEKYHLLLSISVPGIETFAATTGVDNVGHVLGIFDRCRERGIQTVANITVTKINIGELRENIALPLLHGASHVLLNRFLPGGRGLENTEYLLSVDEMNRMFDIAEDVLSRAGVYGHIGTELPYCVIRQPEKYKYLNIASLCSAAKGFFVIDPSGYVKVCNHSPERLCRFTDIGQLPENPYWQRFVRREYIPAECRACGYSHKKCDGGCREAAHVCFGSADAPDPCFGQHMSVVPRRDCHY